MQECAVRLSADLNRREPGVPAPPMSQFRPVLSHCQSDETCRDLEALLNEQALLSIQRFLPQARVFRQFAPSAPAMAGGGRGAVTNAGYPCSGLQSRSSTTLPSPEQAKECPLIPLRDDNPSSITPAVSWALIATCVLVFLWQFSLGPRDGQIAVYALGVIPVVLLEGARLPPEVAMVPPLATVFTSMFLHGGWMHLIGNMLYLWIFGDNVEDSMGHGRFVVFYLLCGVAAVLAQALPDTHSQVPMIGASGAISGVLGAYLLLYPHARVLVLIPLGFFTQLIRLPAGIVLGLWFALQLFNSLVTPAGGGGVAFGAHIGGFVAGIALIPLFKRRGVRLLHPGRRYR